MNAVIIDDDPAAAHLLRALLERDGRVRVIEEARTMKEAKAALMRTDYDLAFLDIQLVDGSGLDLVPVVRPSAHIIFVTGHDHYAVRAFELNALDYIVKPVTAARIEGALRRLGLHQSPAAERRPRRFTASDRIFLKGAAAGGRFAFVQDIVAVFSSENYTEVLLVDGERWLVRRTMQAWLKLLPASSFVRIHRTAIVNVQHIAQIDRAARERTTLRLHGLSQEFQVSRRLWPALRACIEQADAASCKSLDRHAGGTVRHSALARETQSNHFAPSGPARVNTSSPSSSRPEH